MQNRRTFLKKTAAAGLAATAPLAAVPAWANVQTPPIVKKLDEVLPTAAQSAWMDLGFGMFVHYGINTFYDVEWSDGTLDPSKFDPGRKVDADQWCATAKAAGMRYIVLTTKHHDGFCLWPSKYTDYSVSASPYKGDIVAEMVEAAHKHGLKVGFYYSLWDRNNILHDTNEPAYVEWMLRQLEELLTNYGEVVELWFDGFWKKQQSGWSKKLGDDVGENIDREQASKERDEKFINAWRSEGAFRWQIDRVYQFIKALQPNCLVMNNSTSAYPGVPIHPVDIRSGEKYTKVAKDQKVWNWLGQEMYLPLQIETTMSVKGNKKFPSGNWFWHASDTSVASKSTILNYLQVAGKMQANLLLNVGPDDTGKLRKVDEQTLKALRD